jgi:transcriptional regulator with XRE-family HTH domain
MKKINQNLGKTICEMRQERGLSQESFAELADVHRTYISQLERGLKSPTVSILFRIAAALKVNASTILQRIERD